MLCYSTTTRLTLSDPREFSVPFEAEIAATVQPFDTCYLKSVTNLSTGIDILPELRREHSASAVEAIESLVLEAEVQKFESASWHSASKPGPRLTTLDDSLLDGTK